MRGEGYWCDICKAQRGISNHWWLLFVRDACFVLQPWQDGVAKMPTAIHLCGRACAQKKLEEYLSGGLAA